MGLRLVLAQFACWRGLIYLQIRGFSSSMVICFVSYLPYRSSSFILAHIALQRALSWHLPPSLFML